MEVIEPGYLCVGPDLSTPPLKGRLYGRGREGSRPHPVLRDHRCVTSVLTEGVPNVTVTPGTRRRGEDGSPTHVEGGPLSTEEQGRSPTYPLTPLRPGRRENGGATRVSESTRLSKASGSRQASQLLLRRREDLELKTTTPALLVSHSFVWIHHHSHCRHPYYGDLSQHPPEKGYPTVVPS